MEKEHLGLEKALWAIHDRVSDMVDLLKFRQIYEERRDQIVLDLARKALKKEFVI